MFVYTFLGFLSFTSLFCLGVFVSVLFGVISFLCQKKTCLLDWLLISLVLFYSFFHVFPTWCFQRKHKETYTHLVQSLFFNKELVSRTSLHISSTPSRWAQRLAFCAPRKRPAPPGTVVRRGQGARWAGKITAVDGGLHVAEGVFLDLKRKNIRLKGKEEREIRGEVRLWILLVRWEMKNTSQLTSILDLLGLYLFKENHPTLDNHQQRPEPWVRPRRTKNLSFFAWENEQGKKNRGSDRSTMKQDLLKMDLFWNNNPKKACWILFVGLKHANNTQTWTNH